VPRIWESNPLELESVFDNELQSQGYQYIGYFLSSDFSVNEPFFSITRLLLEYVKQMSKFPRKNTPNLCIVDDLQALRCPASTRQDMIPQTMNMRYARGRQYQHHSYHHPTTPIHANTIPLLRSHSLISNHLYSYNTNRANKKTGDNEQMKLTHVNNQCL
jgi:hypothetical protein